MLVLSTGLADQFLPIVEVIVLCEFGCCLMQEVFRGFLKDKVGENAFIVVTLNLVA